MSGNEERGREWQGRLRSITDRWGALSAASPAPQRLLRTGGLRQSPFAFPAALGVAFERDDDELEYFYEMSGKMFLMMRGDTSGGEHKDGVLPPLFFLSGNCIVYAVIMENN